MPFVRSKRREVFFVYFRQLEKPIELLLYQDATTLQPGYILLPVRSLREKRVFRAELSTSEYYIRNIIKECYTVVVLPEH